MRVGWWWMWAGVALAARAAADAPPAVLSRASVPARGRQEAVLRVSAFGRYAITVGSPQGTALQLVDRIAGPGETRGTVGKADGRLDVFLDRGEYQVVTWAHENGSGDARLDVRGFTERNAPAPPLLVELKVVESTLDDLEQRSYWLDVKERRRVTLEAAGRSLADLRLWTNGDWLVDAEPSREVVSPKPGRAIAVCRLVADLDPGLYLLTAYGGVSVPQAEESGEHAFHLRFGVPVLGAVGRGRHVVSPFGTDYWLVPGTATYFRLELPDAVPAALRLGADATRVGAPLPDASAEASAAITKNSVVPVAELDVARRDAATRRLVTVSGAPGQAYVLQHFDRGAPLPWGGRYWVLPRDGTYWISTVHSGDPADSVDATAIVTRLSRARAAAPHVKPAFAQVVELAEGGWVRRCNLLDTLTVFVRVPTAGSYELLARGTEARFRIEPFLVSRPQGYEPPPLRAGGGVWDLEPGYYVLTAEPVKKGILDVALRAAGADGDPFAALRTGSGTAIRAATQFPSVHVAADTVYTLYLNQQPEVSAGLVARMLPLDLTDPLPVTQRPGEQVTLRFTAREPGALRAEADDGTLVAVSVDGAPAVPSQTVTPGEHRLEIRSAAETTVNYALALEPVALQAATPLPPLPDPARAVPPALPVLTDATPRFFDLERRADRTFLVRADVPALYRLETTGLLATAGRLRTRTVTAFDRASANGVGRNFFLQQFLREGDYQVTVATEGESKGHLGLRLARTELIDGGELSEGGAARRALGAGDAIAYRVTVREAGDYRVRSFGEGRTFRCRLEDDAGWPIEPPNVPADLVRRFAPGTYRIISMPEPVATRRLTLVERIRQPEKREGHGPHRLPLATMVRHVWNEPEPGAERVPDSWLFTLPAPVDARVHLSGEMQGRLVGQDGTEVAVLPPGRGWTGHLAAGRYRLDATCARPDNRVPYDVGIWPDQLVAGVDREVAAPARVPVSVGRDGLVQLGSFGSDDVRARLFDAQERLVAASDDGFDDWNFQIQTRLAAGTYRLLVEPVGRDAANTRVVMRAPVEAVGPPLALPARTRFRLRDRVEVRPLAVPAGSELLVLAARAPEGVGCALEAAAPDGDFRTIGSAVGRVARVETPLLADGRYRIRVWSVDGRKIKVDVAAAALTPPRAAIARLASGLTLARVGGADPAAAAVAVELDRPGVFRLTDGAGVRACLAPDAPCAAAPAGIVAATGRALWLVADAAGATVAASRVVLASGDAVPVETPAAVDLASAKGGPVVAVASSLADQPGIRIVERGAAGERDGRGMAVGVRSATAVTLVARDPVAVVWPATGAGPLQADVRAWTFAPPASGRAGWGTSAGALDGVAARALDLPAGAKRVRLVLGEATVAVLSDAERVASVHAATGAPLDETVETTATRLTVLHTRAATDRWRVELLPLAGAGVAPALAPGGTWERAELEAGTLRLAVAPSPADPERPAVVHVRGATGDPVLVTDDGRVARGTDLPLTAGGTLLVPHPPGFVLAWVDRRGEEASDLWGPDTAAAETRVEPPAIVRLDAAVESMRLEPAEPAMLHLRSATPAVVLLARGDAPPEVTVHPAGVVVDAYVGAGPVRLGLRALGSRALAGTAEVTTSPVAPIREGLGPEVLLPAGATALFSFAVTREGPVGIGVRATPDVVGCTLLDTRGKTLGTGVVQMPTLMPGTYLLALHAPAESGPVAARPALAGIELPGTGPPADVVREYMQAAR